MERWRVTMGDMNKFKKGDTVILSDGRTATYVNKSTCKEGQFPHFLRTEEGFITASDYGEVYTGKWTPTVQVRF
jgi:hypothetical protein